MTLKQLLLANRVAAGVATALLLVIMIGPFQHMEQLFGLNDFAAHALAFYALSLVTFTIAPGWRRNDLAIAVFALGALIEFVQAGMGRSASFIDLGADALGVGAAVLPSLVDRLRHHTRARPYTSVTDMARLDRRQSARSASVAQPSRVARREAFRKPS
ncbi:hypothetical protein BH09PSE1_BH09PSE1_04890 [soil metagenome]